MTQYLLSVIHDWDAPAPAEDEIQDRFDTVDRFNTEMMETGRWVFGGGLLHPNNAKVVTATATTDGPYLETKEQLGGFWVLEAADQAEAEALAVRAAAACQNPIELRPFEAEPPTPA